MNLPIYESLDQADKYFDVIYRSISCEAYYCSTFSDMWCNTAFIVKDPIRKGHESQGMFLLYLQILCYLKKKPLFFSQLSTITFPIFAIFFPFVLAILFIAEIASKLKVAMIDIPDQLS